MEIKHFEKLLSEAQKYQQPQRERTFFDTAIRKHYENPTTELLSYFLNPENDHGLGSVFFDGLTDAVNALNPSAEADEYGAVRNVFTEVQTTSGNRIDLLVESDKAVFLIESKIHHSQNNPFEDYEKHIATHFQTLTPFKIVFCIDGKTAVKGWVGVSFSLYAHHVNTFLSQAMLKNPYNKWALLAREFLMHLESFGEKNMNNENFNFVQENYKDISALVQLKENFISEIINQTNAKLEANIENYVPYNRRQTWGKDTVLRFANRKWVQWSDASIRLKMDSSPLVCDVFLCLEDQNLSLQSKIKENLKHPLTLRSPKEEYEGKDNKFWWLGWENIPFDLEQISNMIVEINQVLHQVETVWRNELGQPA